MKGGVYRMLTKQTASGKLPLCRTATGRELKMKRREDDRTE